MASSVLTCSSSIVTQLLPPSQTPLQESLIDLSDSSLNKMATDMFLGVGGTVAGALGWVASSAV